jgi:hypothetical protein
MLIRRLADLFKKRDERKLHQSQTVLKKENIDPMCLPATIKPDNPETEHLVETPHSPSSPNIEKPAATVLLAPAQTRATHQVRFSDEQQLSLPPDIQNLVREVYKKNTTIQSILEVLDKGYNKYPAITLVEYER